MFGYVRTDTPYLFIKDETLYKAMYCGLCKGIAASCGQRARMGLTYDLTFFSVMLHNIANIDVTVEKSHCLTHCIRSRQMANVDELTKKIGALNTLLAYYKFTDDIADGDHGKVKRAWFAAGKKRAAKRYPEMDQIVRAHLVEQERVEKQNVASPDRAADASARLVAKVSEYLLEDKATPYTSGLFYAVGKWIYLIDALDDYDKDRKKGSYNPFVVSYGRASKEELMKLDGEEVRYLFNALFFDIRENLSRIEFHFNRDLSDNILLRGLPIQTERVMRGCNEKKGKKAPKQKGNEEKKEE